MGDDIMAIAALDLPGPRDVGRKDIGDRP
jgi:hypothetical protein